MCWEALALIIMLSQTALSALDKKQTMADVKSPQLQEEHDFFDQAHIIISSYSDTQTAIMLTE